MSKEKKPKLTPQQQKHLESIMESVRFQDSFFTKTLTRLQKTKDAVRFRRLSELWLNGKRALEYFAKDANLAGMQKVIDERQRFIDDCIVGRVKLFDENSPEIQ
jgi:hypothetical protein